MALNRRRGYSLLLLFIIFIIIIFMVMEKVTITNNIDSTNVGANFNTSESEKKKSLYIQKIKNFKIQNMSKMRAKYLTSKPSLFSSWVF